MLTFQSDQLLGAAPIAEKLVVRQRQKSNESEDPCC